MADKNEQPKTEYRRTPSNVRKPSSASKPTSGIGRVGGSYVRNDRKLGLDKDGLHIPTGNSEVLLSRRQLLYGAAGLAGIAAVGGTAAAIGNMAENQNEVESLAVSAGDVFTVEDCAEVPTDDVMALIAEFKLPFGSLLWAGNDTVAACLKPSTKASPLVTAALLNLTSGYESTVLTNAIGQKEGFEIYDMRASDDGAVWTEANILTGAWRIYTSPISMMELTNPALADEGDASTEMPTLAAIGKNAFWQVVPVEPAEGEEEGDTEVRMAPFDKPDKAATIYTAKGRCATAIMPANAQNAVVITPRHADARSHRQILVVGQDGTVIDSLTFPSRMTPMEACYGSSGFAFSFESIYNYGDGIANLGTYTPQSKPEGGQYSNRSWFTFTRTPSMPPAWCDGWFMVKSTSAVVAVDLTSKRYTMFPTDNSAETYGDCLASIGENGTAVIFTNIDRTAAVRDNQDVTDDDKLCYVRVYTTRENAGTANTDDEDAEEAEE